MPRWAGWLRQLRGVGNEGWLFTIGNYIRQRLLRPVHDWCMRILRGLVCDGTYDQTKPLSRLAGFNIVYSFDLKSATDRWPLEIMFEVIKSVFSEVVAVSAVTTALGLTPFKVGPPLVKREQDSVFSVGQPLGFYSSWPLFALSHHVILWIAADRVYPGKKFRAYAILGDDVVIADRRVAEQYRSILQLLGVTISEQKSLISNSGAFEFAKRFYVRSGRIDLSPFSMRALLMCRSTPGLAAVFDKYNLNLKTLLRLAGAGYRVLATMPSFTSNKWRRIWVYCNRPRSTSQLPLDLWLGDGLPLNPYLKARLVEVLRKHFRPRDLKLPAEGFLAEEEDELVESTVTLNWVKSYLRYLHWYCTVALSLDPPLQAFFDAPVLETSWRRSNKNEMLIRFGVLWRLYDTVHQDPNWRPGILTPLGNLYVMQNPKIAKELHPAPS